MTRLMLAAAAVALLAGGCATSNLHVLTVVPAEGHATVGGEQMLAELKDDLPELEQTVGMTPRAGEARKVLVVTSLDDDARLVRETLDGSERWLITEDDRVRERRLKRYLDEHLRD